MRMSILSLSGRLLRSSSPSLSYYPIGSNLISSKKSSCAHNIMHQKLSYSDRNNSTVSSLSQTKQQSNHRISRTNSNNSRFNGNIENETEGPTGDLFNAKVGTDLVKKYASINRTFGPGCNAEAMLTCGGKELARHASFDPHYSRAKDWIRHHPVGPAVVSPVLISGLLGALVEAAIPQSIPLSSSIESVAPLIVGVEINARIEVESITKEEKKESKVNKDDNSKSLDRGEVAGYELKIFCEATMIRDGSVIATGYHYVLVPDYMHM